MSSADDGVHFAVHDEVDVGVVSGHDVSSSDADGAGVEGYFGDVAAAVEDFLFALEFDDGLSWCDGFGAEIFCCVGVWVGQV